MISPVFFNLSTMKKFLLFLLCSTISIGAFADGVLEFSYAQGELGAFGKGKKETIDVAMCIDDPSMEGVKLTGIKAYINTTEGIDNSSLWLSSELIVEKKENVPDIASYDVTPIATTYNGEPLGLLQITLDTPYTLTGDPLYIGYTINVNEIETEEEKYPIIISKGVNSNGFFLHMSKTLLKWMDYSENVGGVAFIVAELEGEFEENSLGIMGYNPIYAMNQENFEAEFIVSNKGQEEIKSLSYIYSFDNSDEEFEGSVELPLGIQPNLALTSPVTLSFKSISGLGKHTLNLNITEINGKVNESLFSSMEANVNVIPFKPSHRPLIEEYTGLWCGWCTGGYLAMEKIAEKYGNEQVSICYHNGDPMEVTSDYAMNISGFPSASIDRISVIDPIYGTTDQIFGIFLDVENTQDKIAFANIELETSISENVIEVNSSTMFIQDFDDANYEVGYVLVSDGLSNPSWAQKNYYSNSKEFIDTPLEELTEWPSVVTGLVFNDVAIDVSAMRGINGSLPSQIKVGQQYVGTYSFDIADNKLATDIQNLKVVAYVIDKNNGTIINANKCGIGTSAINQISSDKIILSKEIYDLSGRKITNPSSGIYLVKEINNDGSVKTYKKVIK